MKLPMQIDAHNQWFVYCWVKINDRLRSVRFKVDTGCNALVLSHDTLKRFGYDASPPSLVKLPSVSGMLASGDKHVFKKLGNISLFSDNGQKNLICNVQGICHAAQETNDLLGTEVLKCFLSVRFNLSKHINMEFT